MVKLLPTEDISPTLWADFLHHSPDLFCIAGTSGYLRWVSASFTRVLGWSAEELCARHFLEFVHPDDIDATLAEVERLKQGQPAVLFENRYITKDQGYRWLQWNTVPNDDGTLFCNVRDVTQAKETQHLAEQRRGWLEAMEKIAQVGYWRVDLENNQIHWSDEVFRIHGMEPQDRAPDLTAAMSFYHPEDRAHVEEHMARAIAERGSFRFELRLVRADGDMRWVESYGYCEADASGKVVAVLGAFIDITKRMQTQAVLKERNASLEQFAYIASHDLQEPLRMVGSYADLLTNRYAKHLDERGVRFLGYVQQGAERMQHMVADLLAYSRTGRTSEERIEVDLNVMFKSVLQDLEALLHETQGVVETATLPAVVGYPTMLRQLLQNLVGNALKFHAPGKPPRVQLRSHESEGFWHVSVADNGIGFEMKHAERILRPFQRLHVRGTYAGTGVGLSVCQRVLEHHGGSLEIASTPGVGSDFTFCIPKVKPTERASQELS